MKRIEEILKSKLGGTKAEANPSMDDALWNKVESGLKGSLPAGGTAGHAIGRTWAVFGGVTLFAAGVGVGLMWDEKQFHDPVTQSIEATDVEEHVRAQSSSEAREPQSAATFSEAEGSSNSSNEVEPTLTDASHEHAPLRSSALNTRNNDRTETVEREPAVQTAMPAQPSADAGAPFHTQITEAPRSREGQPVLEPQSPFIPPLALNPIGISGDHNSAEPFLQHMNRDMPAHARHFAIRAFGGLTLSQFQYRTEDLRAFSNRFHTASSGGGGFAFDFEYKDQDWSVGLGWLDFAQRLEFEHTWQTEFTDPNGIVSVEIDQISGDTIAMETGPLLVTATHHRHVRDFNHISAIVIPMEWRKQVLFSSWTLGTGVGGQFLIRTGANGQSFVAEGTLARFDDADLPRQRISWSPTARVYAGYQFFPEWQLDFSVAAGFQPMGSMNREDLVNPLLTPWEGQLRTLQIAGGITHFFQASRKESNP